MSLYIGHKSDGVTPLVHLTSGSHDIATINNNPIFDTVFHSDIDVFQISNVITYSPAIPNVSGYERFIADTPLTNFINKIVLVVCTFQNGSKLSSFGICQGATPHIYRNDGPSYYNMISIDAFSNHEPATNYYVSRQYGIYVMPITSIVCYVIDSVIDTNGVISLASSHKTNNEIFISKTSCIIGGVDIFSKPILCAVPNKTTTNVWFPFPYRTIDSYALGDDDIQTAFYNASTNVIHNGTYYGLLSKNTTDLQLYSDHISQSFNGSDGQVVVSSNMTINSLVKQAGSIHYTNASGGYHPITTIGNVAVSSWYPSITPKIIIGFHMEYDVIVGQPGIQGHQNFSNMAIIYEVLTNNDNKIFAIPQWDGNYTIYESITLYANYSNGAITFKFSSGDQVSNLTINLTVNQFI